MYIFMEKMMSSDFADFGHQFVMSNVSVYGYGDVIF